MSAIPHEGVQIESYTRQRVRFVYRVAGVAIAQGRVLLHRSEGDEFWALPGGRVEAMETAESALVREMREEIALEVRVGRLLFIVENFFHHEGEDFHEIGLYFTMDVPAAWEEDRAGVESRRHLTFRWFSQRDVPDTNVLPAFLRRRLIALPEHPMHIVHRGGE